MTDESDGTLVTTLEGVTLEDVRGWVRDGPPSGHVMAMLEGDRLVPIDTPDSIMRQQDGVAMAGVGARHRRPRARGPERAGRGVATR